MAVRIFRRYINSCKGAATEALAESEPRKSMFSKINDTINSKKK